jgi:hypothetical protein
MSKAKTKTTTHPQFSEGQKILLRLPEENPTLGAMTLFMLNTTIALSQEYQKAVLHALEHDVIPAGFEFVEAVVRFPSGVCRDMMTERLLALTSHNGIELIPVVSAA